MKIIQVSSQEMVLGWWRTGDESGLRKLPYSIIMQRNWYTHIMPLPSPPESGEGEDYDLEMEDQNTLIDHLEAEREGEGGKG